MNILTPLFGLIVTLLGLLMPIVAFFVVPFIKWDKDQSYAQPEGPDEFDSSFITRGDLPRFLSWFATPDQRFPGGMYEKAIESAYGNGSYLRRLWTSYLWIGHRNRLQGLAAALGRQALAYIPDYADPAEDKSLWKMSGWYAYYRRQSDDVWKLVVFTGPIHWSFGYQVYRFKTGKFWAYPLFTARVSR